MFSPANRFGCPGPGENSSRVLAPLLGPLSMPMSAWMQLPLPGIPGAGAAVSTCPADRLPQSAMLADNT